MTERRGGSRADTTSRLIEIASRFLVREEDSTLPLDRDLRELGLSSVSAIEFLLEVESTFQIIFPEASINSDTFGSLERLSRTVQKLQQE